MRGTPIAVLLILSLLRGHAQEAPGEPYLSIRAFTGIDIHFGVSLEAGASCTWRNRHTVYADYVTGYDALKHGASMGFTWLAFHPGRRRMNVIIDWQAVSQNFKRDRPLKIAQK